MKTVRCSMRKFLAFVFAAFRSVGSTKGIYEKWLISCFRYHSSDSHNLEFRWHLFRRESRKIYIFAWLFIKKCRKTFWKAAWKMLPSILCFRYFINLLTINTNLLILFWRILLYMHEELCHIYKYKSCPFYWYPRLFK